VNSGPLIDRLRVHARDGEFEVAWVGEGWRPLVEGCHERLVGLFPEYELLNIKQKYGVLAYQAFPRPWSEGEQRWSSAEFDALEAVTEEYRSRSETVCEWCGAAAVLRSWRTVELTLCDVCDRRFFDPPVQTPIK
jgi:hypothetical protein